MDMLTEIMTVQKVKTKYRLGLCTRLSHVLCVTICSVTVCVPCLCWDCACCTVSQFLRKGSPCKWGVGFGFIQDTCDRTWEDERKTALSTCLVIPKVVFIRVLNAYLTEFDSCIRNGKAKEANIIRATLIEIIKKYSPGFRYMSLKDTGDIEELREIIRDMPRYMDMYKL